MSRVAAKFLILFALCIPSLCIPAGTPAQETGYASFYAGKFQGRLTANGERFDTKRFTAAHKALPFNSVVRVTNLENDLSVLVRINDRGPFVEGRIIDLSRVAAAKIEMIGNGIARVSVELIVEGDNKTYHNSGYQLERVNVQVASFGDRENSARAKQDLESAGFDIDLEPHGREVTRVVVVGVPVEDLQLTKARLAELGFPDVLVRQW